MDPAIAIWCLVAPAVVMIAGVVAAYWVAGSSEAQKGNPAGLASIVVVTSWVAALIVVLVGRQGLAGWPEEAWQQVLAPLSLGALGYAFLSQRAAGVLFEMRWTWAASFAVLTGMTAMASGEGWEDTYVLHRRWIPYVALSIVANVWSLSALANAGAVRWVSWVGLAGLAGPTILAAVSYGGLAELLSAACIATTVGALLAVVVTRFPVWIVSIPATFFAGAGTASARLYTWESYPWWVYGVALFLPTMVYLGDLFLQKCPTWQRVVAAAVMSAVLLLMMSWGLFGGESTDEYSLGVHGAQIAME